MGRSVCWAQHICHLPSALGSWLDDHLRFPTEPGNESRSVKRSELAEGFDDRIIFLRFQDRARPRVTMERLIFIKLKEST